MYSVLVVEDELDIQSNIKTLLEEEGYYVLTSNDGEAGYKIASEFLPDIIISDINMPNLNGYELLQLLQEGKDTALIPFLFLTAKVDMEDLRFGMNLGADDYIIKPYKAQDLLKAINLRLAKKEINGENVKELKEQLITRVPHELRTPLVGILGFSEIIKEDIESLPLDEIKSMVDVIHRSGKRLLKRIEKMLQFSELVYLDKNEIENNKNICTPFEIESASFSNEIINYFYEYKRNEDMYIQLDDARLLINDRYFKTILYELLENSILFSEKGTSILVRGWIEDQYYKIKIHDHGSGMDKKSINNIDLLNQFSKNIYDHDGMGVGLSLAKKSLKYFNGYLKIESKEDHFTIVEIGIPIAFGLINMDERGSCS
ncbi:MAG: response regulator [Melioribacteraceae bacterium]|nr:response regulator [Melioribacteraceae bacterium]